jgi:hypothetical protein
MQVGANAAAAKDKAQRQQETEGMRMGLDAQKHRAQIQSQYRQQNMQSIQNRQSSKKGDK